MGIQLLDKTRKINKLLHNNRTKKLVFNDICAVLSEILESSILVISRKGKILGIGTFNEEEGKKRLIVGEVGEFVDPLLNNRLLQILSTKENVNLTTLGFEQDVAKEHDAIIVPIEIASERLGSLFIYGESDRFGIDDIILSEYASTVVGLEMLRSLSEEHAEENRKRSIVQSAMSTLSYSELEAIVHIFEELGAREGVLVASRIADNVGITRSVIVNALRKFESAGVIESRSSGMRGTYIKIVNEYVYDALDEVHRHVRREAQVREEADSFSSEVTAPVSPSSDLPSELSSSHPAESVSADEKEKKTTVKRGRKPGKK